MSNPRPSHPPPAPSWAPGGAGGGGGAVQCDCGQDALLLSVRKDGPNQGRTFYKCTGGGCNFFLWADEPAQQGAPAPRPPQAPRPSLGLAPPGGPGSETLCNCSEVAVTRTVHKDGPNKGRKFNTCGRPRDQQCSFFQWADESPPPGKHTCTGSTHTHLHR